MPFVPFDAIWITLGSLLVTSAGCYARLRHRHPAVWYELGCPRILPTRSLAPSAALTRFYWSRRVTALADPSLHRWVLALRVQQVFLATGLAVMAQRLFFPFGECPRSGGVARRARTADRARGAIRPEARRSSAEFGFRGVAHGRSPDDVG